MKILFLAGIVIGLAVTPYVKAERPVRVIFDTDMGNDIDDALALAMLYEYAREGQAELLAVTVNKEYKASLEYIDILNNWYGFPDLPLGKITGSKAFYHPKTSYVDKVVENPAYKRTYSDYDSLPESVALYRRILAGERDQSVVIISVGFLTNLSRLLASPPDGFSRLNGLELVRKKVRMLYVMGGEFEGKQKVKEFNIRFDVSSACRVFSSWPTPVRVSPVELGEQILFPGSRIETCLEEQHPLAVAYKAFRQMPYDRPTWDLTTVLAAIEPEKGYFTAVSPGHIQVGEDAYTYFIPCNEGPCRILKPGEGKVALIRQRFIDLVSP